MRLATATFLALALAIPVAAQDPTPEAAPRTEPPSTIGAEPVTAPSADPAALALLATSNDGLTFDQFEGILKAAGTVYQRMEGDNGPYVQAATSAGVNYEMWLFDCDATTAVCRGLTLHTFYFRETPKITLKALNDWNLNAVGIRAFLYSDGQSAMVMNVGVDGGVTGNWVANRVRDFDYWASAYNIFWDTGDPKSRPN